MFILSLVISAFSSLICGHPWSFKAKVPEYKSAPKTHSLCTELQYEGGYANGINMKGIFTFDNITAESLSWVHMIQRYLNVGVDLIS